MKIIYHNMTTSFQSQILRPCGYIFKIYVVLFIGVERGGSGIQTKTLLVTILEIDMEMPDPWKNVFKFVRETTPPPLKTLATPMRYLKKMDWTCQYKNGRKQWAANGHRECYVEFYFKNWLGMFKYFKRRKAK